MNHCVHFTASSVELLKILSGFNFFSDFYPFMQTQLIDTHCHLYGKAFSADRSDVMKRAMDAGVQRFYLPAIDQETFDELLQLEAAYPGKCFAMAGLHPVSVGASYQEELKFVETWLSKRSFVAVGEIGLDYHWDKTFIKEQQEAFHRQIEWALQYEIPIVIHSRESMDDCIRMVREHQQGQLRGIFHCFTGTAAQAQEIIDNGFYLGIGGVLTYKNSGLAAALENIPLENMVLETDAPYLTPVPFRGKRNESSYITYVAEALAGVKKVSVAEVGRITTANAQKIFGT